MGAEQALNNTKITAMLVEDDYFARQAMATMMDADDIEVVGVAENPDEAIEKAQATQPRVALIDMRMQGDNRAGVEVIRSIRKVSPNTACCVVTGVDLTGDNFADAMFAGAQGYTRKGDIQNIDLRELIRRLARGSLVIDTELAAKFLGVLGYHGQLPPHLVGSNKSTRLQRAIVGEEPRLTGREREVLMAAALQLSTKEIADKLTISANTVKTHLQHIIDRFQVQNREQAVLYAILKGMLSETTESDVTAQ